MDDDNPWTPDGHMFLHDRSVDRAADKLMDLDTTLCLAPRCRSQRAKGNFCAEHASAPSVRRAGWASAAKRKSKICIDASNIAPRLWVGGAPPTLVDIPEVDVLVLCAQEIQPPMLAFHGQVLRCPMPDAELTPNKLNQTLVTASTVAKALIDGKRVLSTCAMGRNRSALVASLALGGITWLSADDLINLMRLRRDPLCLSNQHFQKYLRRFIGPGRRRR